MPQLGKGVPSLFNRSPILDLCGPIRYGPFALVRCHGNWKACQKRRVSRWRAEVTAHRPGRCSVEGAANRLAHLSGRRDPMVAKHDYDDIPGTFVFDADRSRKGYGI